MSTMHSVTLLAINIAAPRRLDVGGKAVETGIFKSPAARRVAVEPLGIAGDAVCDLARHGGPDQAIYLYSAEDQAWWARTLQRDIGPGYFGENLTIDCWWPSPRVGDRLVFGSVEFEISFPRIPCATLAARVGDPRFVKRFVAARRPGLYARVLHRGEVEVGSRGVVRPASDHHPTAAELFDCWHSSPRDFALMRSALQTPIAERARAGFEHWLCQSHAPNEA